MIGCIQAELLCTVLNKTDLTIQPEVSRLEYRKPLGLEVFYTSEKRAKVSQPFENFWRDKMDLGPWLVGLA